MKPTLPSVIPAQTPRAAQQKLNPADNEPTSFTDLSGPFRTFPGIKKFFPSVLSVASCSDRLLPAYPAQPSPTISNHFQPFQGSNNPNLPSPVFDRLLTAYPDPASLTILNHLKPSKDSFPAKTLPPLPTPLDPGRFPAQNNAKISTNRNNETAILRSFYPLRSWGLSFADLCGLCVSCVLSCFPQNFPLSYPCSSVSIRGCPIRAVSFWLRLCRSRSIRGCSSALFHFRCGSASLGSFSAFLPPTDLPA